jgi:hypothetical protein
MADDADSTVTIPVPQKESGAPCERALEIFLIYKQHSILHRGNMPNLQIFILFCMNHLRGIRGRPPLDNFFHNSTL